MTFQQEQASDRRRALRRATWLTGLIVGLGATGASAATFVVDSAVDARDEDPSDGICADASGNCTLRAAIEQSNATRGMDTVRVPELPGGAHYIVTGSGPSSVLAIEDATNFEGDGRGRTIIDGEQAFFGARQLLRVRTTQAIILDMTEDELGLIGYNGLGQGLFSDQGELGGAQHILLDPFQTTLLVLTFDDGILKYDAITGQYLGVFLSADATGEPYYPVDLTWGDDAETVFITDSLPGGDVLKFHPTDPQPTVFIPGSGTDAPTAILRTSIGGSDAFLVGYYGGTIRRYDDAGNFVGIFASGIPGIRDMLRVGDRILVSSDGLNAVAQIDAQTGTGEGIFALPGEGGLDGPTYLTLDRQFERDWYVYVVSSNSNQILAFDAATGDFVREMVAGGTSSLGQVGTVALRHWDGGPGVNMRGFTLTRGASQDLTYAGCLGIDRGADVVATDIEVTACWASTYGGGIRNDGTFYMYRGEVSACGTSPAVGGQTSVGGGISNSGYMHIEDSLIVGNDASKGGGISTASRPILGIPVDVDPSTTIVNSTITGNTSDGQGGGIRANDGVTRIASSTITQNTTAVTAGENFPYGGGLWVRDQATVFVGNTIIAENSDGRDLQSTESSADCRTEAADTLRSYANNVIGVLNDNCQIEDVNQGDLYGITYWNPWTQPASEQLELDLRPLADNGGPTRTHYLGADSVAVDAHIYASLGIFECGLTDQRRDSPRPLDGDDDGQAICDIGAVEVQPSTSQDEDGDGIHDFIDTEPDVFSNEFDDAVFSGNTSGEIVDRGAQAVTIEDSDEAGSGVVVRTDPAGHGTPAVIVACDGNVIVEMGPGQEQTISCVSADVGGPYVFECTDSNFAQGTLQGSGQSVYGGEVEYLWDSPVVTLSPVDEATTSGLFPIGGTPISLQVTADDITIVDSGLVVVQDPEPPVVTAPPTVFLDTCGGTLNLGQASAVDQCAGELTPEPSSIPDVTSAGTYFVEWSVRDAAGNLGTATQAVVVGIGPNTGCCPPGYNVITGTAGNDVLNGTSGNDCIFGSFGNDTINGLGGNDIISGSFGNDTINGGDGDDVIQGGPGADVIDGGIGNDSLHCGDGNDQCSGGAGDDVIGGGNNDDTLRGGEGNDLLAGNAGQDQCIDDSGENTFTECELVVDGDDVLGVQFVQQSPGDAWGYCVDVVVTNPHATTATNISIAFQVTGGSIANSWNATRTGSTGVVTMVPNQPTWNTWIDAGQTKTLFGFCVQHNPLVPLPTLVSADADL